MKIMIKAVIFDFDGLMFDTEILWKQVFQKFNKKFNINITEKTRSTFIGKNETLVRQELRIAYPALDVDKYRECQLEEVNKIILTGKPKAKKGLFELLDFLQHNNYKMAIISGNSLHKISFLLEKNKIDVAMFNPIVSGESNMESKPSPQPFLYCAKQMKVKPGECVMLEDGYNGIRGAFDAGCKCIMIPDTVPPTAEMREKATILNDLTEVITYLKSQND